MHVHTVHKQEVAPPIVSLRAPLSRPVSPILALSCLLSAALSTASGPRSRQVRYCNETWDLETSPYATPPDSTVCLTVCVSLGSAGRVCAALRRSQLRLPPTSVSSNTTPTPTISLPSLFLCFFFFSSSLLFIEHLSVGFFAFFSSRHSFRTRVITTEQDFHSHTDFSRYAHKHTRSRLLSPPPSACVCRRKLSPRSKDMALTKQARSRNPDDFPTLQLFLLGM